MRRHERHHPSDHDDAPDITQEFWGRSDDWSDRAPTASPRSNPSAPTPRRRSAGGDDTTGAIRAIRDGVAAFRPQTSEHATGQIDRTRQHGIVRPPAVRDRSDRRSDAAWSDDGWFDERYDDHAVQPMVPLASGMGDRLGLGTVDPLVLRIGIFLLAIAVLLPIAWSMRDDAPGAVVTGPGAAPVEQRVAATVLDAAPDAGSASAAGEPSLAPAGSPDPAVAPAAQADTSTEQRGEMSPTPPPALESTAPPESSNRTVDPPTSAAAVTDPAPVATEAPSGIDDEPATVDSVAERVVPECPLTYIVQAGDSWYAIAEAAGVTPTALVSENRAALDSVILPGDEICLPAGATVPTTVPTTTTPSTTPTDTTPPTDPDTTPPTDPDSPPAEHSPEEVQQLIREIWPDDLEEKALEVAYRESRYQHDAYNGWCCYGVFQIYWSVHQSWLDDYDIFTAEDLFDARKNIEAAYALYQAAGGWSPWSQTAY